MESKRKESQYYTLNKILKNSERQYAFTIGEHGQGRKYEERKHRHHKVKEQHGI